ncbi:MAG TPA: hypothetical protein VLJ58_04595, partial [Ramlibacter sp.]|nr:hypothetical protein [Ramlibacter sp.]
YHRKPYNLVPPAPALEPVAAQIEAFYDDEAHYAAMCERALRVGQSRHRLEASTQRLMQALEPLAQRRAGDGDTGAALQQWHLHGLDDRVVLSQAAAPDAAPGLQGAARP